MINISERLKNKINLIPELPGVYKMLDSKGNIIYIGKSKCLKKRVKTYFVNNPKWEKVNRMVSLINDIEYIVTDTHLEAMLLECELIKAIQPFFNSQMKNDRRYVYLKVEDYNRYNVLKIVSSRESNTYGPFRRMYYLKDIINSFKNIYPIKKINNCYQFEYHLFPETMDRETFENNKYTLIDLFNNETNLNILIDNLTEKMKIEAEKNNFETAIIFRDIIEKTKYLRNSISRYKDILEKNILLKLPTEDGFKLFFISKGRIILKESYLKLSKEDIIAFLDKGRNLRLNYSFEMDEKTYLDYRDIICSEILNLSDEMVTIL